MTGSATPPFLSTAIEGVEPHPSGRVVVGFNWTAVEGPRAIGLAATPSRADGARTTPRRVPMEAERSTRCHNLPCPKTFMSERSVWRPATRIGTLIVLI